MATVLWINRLNGRFIKEILIKTCLNSFFLITKTLCEGDYISTVLNTFVLYNPKKDKKF